MSSSRNSSLVNRTLKLLPQSSDEDSVKFAKSLATRFEALLTDNQVSEAALLSGIGMARHPSLINMRTRVLQEEGKAVLSALEARCQQHRFMDPHSKVPTSADGALAWSAREVVDLVLEPADRGEFCWCDFL